MSFKKPFVNNEGFFNFHNIHDDDSEDNKVLSRVQAAHLFFNRPLPRKTPLKLNLQRQT